ncbi:MAG: MarR family winged helix-turn-helix transcriptional regulator [Anaerovoracaceae bacterium]
MEKYNTINDVLVNLFNEIWEIEKIGLITEEFTDLTVNDMHVIEAVGLGSGDKMSVIAKRLNITVGSLTISMNSLVKKGYVVRERSETDRRVVTVRLTEKGVRAFYHHEDFHKKMVTSVLGKLEDKETDVLVESLNNLREFFRNYAKALGEDNK